jgi:hypothetical protein
VNEVSGMAGFEWVLLGVGLALTLIVIGVFVFALTRRNGDS